jgi:hypothetical protein
MPLPPADRRHQRLSRRSARGRAAQGGDRGAAARDRAVAARGSRGAYRALRLIYLRPRSNGPRRPPAPGLHQRSGVLRDLGSLKACLLFHHRGRPCSCNGQSKWLHVANLQRGAAWGSRIRAPSTALPCSEAARPSARDRPAVIGIARQIVRDLEPTDPARGPDVVARADDLGIVQARQRDVQVIGLVAQG